MAVNHVVYNGNVLIDLRNDTVTSADHIMAGHTGHLADGTLAIGTGGSSGHNYTLETIIPRQTLTTNIRVQNGYGAFFTSHSAYPTVGQHYLITLDDTVYVATAFEDTVDNVTAIGDINIIYMGSSTVGRCAFPFAIVNNSGSYFLAVRTNAPHTVKVEKIIFN